MNKKTTSVSFTKEDEDIVGWLKKKLSHRYGPAVSVTFIVRQAIREMKGNLETKGKDKDKQ